MTVGDTIQSVNGAGLGGVVTSYNGLTGPVSSSGTGVDSVDGLTGAVDLSTRYLALTGGTLTGATTASKGLTVNPSTTASIGLTVTGLPSQAGELQRWNSSVAAVASMSAAGVFSAVALTAGSAPAATGDVRLSSDSAINWHAQVTGDVAGFSLNASNKVQSGGDLVPSANGTLLSGGPSLRWAGVYTNAVIVGATPATSGAVRLTSTEGLTWRNAANNADLAGWGSNASDQLQTGMVMVPASDNSLAFGTTSRRWSYAHAVRAEVNSTGTFGTNEYFRVGTPTTVDNLANTHIATDLGSNKGIVFQQRPAQAVAMWEVQSSAGASVAAMGVNGALTVASVDSGSGTITTTGTVQGANLIATTSLRAGTTPATSGTIRMPNATGVTARNAANNADVNVMLLNSSDQISLGTHTVPGGDNTLTLGTTSARWATVNSVLGRFSATGGLGTVEKLRVVDPTTTDNAANVMHAASSTTAKPLVIQGKSAQAANLLEVQDSTGASLFAIDPTGGVISASLSGTYETITNVGLKAPKASPTFTGTVTIPNGASATEAAALGQTVTKTGGGVETISTATATGATTVNLTNGNVHKLTLTGAVTLTFSGATNGSGCSMTLYIAQDATGGRTITWPTVKWAGGVAPVISTAANAIDIYTFFTMDGGTTWFGNQAGRGYA